MKKNYKTLMFFGMLFLVLANLSMRFLHPMPHFGEGLVDGTTGMLMGLAIGLNLLAVRVKTRGSRCAN
jgi:hypothetical protein